MLRKLLTDTQTLPQEAALPETIARQLEQLHKKLEGEVAFKTRIIEAGWQEIGKLRGELIKKDETIALLEARIADNQRNIEGNRQLINKLLNDLQRMQQDVAWYQRTYEQRSLLGTIREKLKRIL